MFFGSITIGFLLMLKRIFRILKIFLLKRNIALYMTILVALRQFIINLFNLILSVMLTKMQRADLSQARGLAKWFSVKVEIRVFGKVIWSYVWPPQLESEVCDE